uniref:Reverse transcriptase domain, reverse transcriptase zinc-binding domain protein n=1 Tax=Tanacetum cinerariifolium TaxID=118510 RepID=A0A699QEP4_TANCI|nr:reverse transcriptase domain, reverse transcriptase zinc-binding domain protein [Tanacetum cinerariifolium]
MRKVIEGCILESDVDNIRWNNSIPIKINIHSWRLSNNRLPTRINLDAQGIDLHSVRCPICDEDMETPSTHVY